MSNDKLPKGSLTDDEWAEFRWDHELDGYEDEDRTSDRDEAIEIWKAVQSGATSRDDAIDKIKGLITKVREQERSDIRHVGFCSHRLRHGYAERMYFLKWEAQNKRERCLNGGFGTLELLLAPYESDKNSLLPSYVPPISQRDAVVAATVIQWLGTNCGQGFMHECEHRIKAIRDGDRK